MAITANACGTLSKEIGNFQGDGYSHLILPSSTQCAMFFPAVKWGWIWRPWRCRGVLLPGLVGSDPGLLPSQSDTGGWCSSTGGSGQWQSWACTPQAQVRTHKTLIQSIMQISKVREQCLRKHSHKHEMLNPIPRVQGGSEHRFATGHQSSITLGYWLPDLSAPMTANPFSSCLCPDLSSYLPVSSAWSLVMCLHAHTEESMLVQKAVRNRA